MEKEETLGNDPEQGLEIENFEEEKDKQACGRSRIGCIAAIVVGSILALYGFLLLIIPSLQFNLLYHPNSNIATKPLKYPYQFGSRILNETEHLSRTGGWREIELLTEDGVTLHNFWIHANKSKSGDPDVPVTILYFHGNGDRIDYSAPFFKRIHRQLNCNIFLLSYRGYGLSSGIPDEKGIKIDAQTALNWILKNISTEEKKNIVVFGRSLGGAVAIDLFSKNNDKVNSLIVENTFLSIPKLATDMSVFLYPFVFSIHQIFDSATAIQSITVPILFLSGKNDTLIPPAHMKKLKELAIELNSTFLEYPDVGHNDTFSSPTYFDDIVKFLKTIR